MVADSENSFIIKLDSKFAIKKQSGSHRRRKRVTTLPSEIYDIILTMSGHLFSFLCASL